LLKEENVGTEAHNAFFFLLLLTLYRPSSQTKTQIPSLLMNTGAAVAGLTGGATAPEKSKSSDFKDKHGFRYSF